MKKVFSKESLSVAAVVLLLFTPLIGAMSAFIISAVLLSGAGWVYLKQRNRGGN